MNPTWPCATDSVLQLPPLEMAILLGDDNVRAPTFQRPAEDFFARAVSAGGINQIDTEIKSSMNDPDGLLDVRPLVVRRAAKTIIETKFHGAESKTRNTQPGVPQLLIFHSKFPRGRLHCPAADVLARPRSN